MIPYWTDRGTIDLAALRPADMTADILGEVLARIHRFNGRLPEPWSVAEHSVLVEYLCPPELGPWALLHDAHEVFVGDITTPAVDLISEVGGRATVRAVERTKGHLDRVIGAAWGTPVRSLNIHLQRADLLAASAEAVVLMGADIPGVPWADRPLFRKGIHYLQELPHSRDWRWARDHWLQRIAHHARLGHLTPPPAQTTGPAEPGTTTPRRRE